MSAPRLLDLFCGAGGCSAGYVRAGFVHRPRLFESNVLILTPSPQPRSDLVIGVYGTKPDGRRLNTRLDGRIQRAAASLEEAQQAMGIDWMTDWRDICEAIPPAYTEHIGSQLLAHLTSLEATP